MGRRAGGMVLAAALALAGAAGAQPGEKESEKDQPPDSVTEAKTESSKSGSDSGVEGEGLDQDQDQDQVEGGLSAVEVKGEPRPGQARGIARPADRGLAGLLWIPRSLLFFPRAALELANAPIRGAMYAYYRYNLKDRARSIFFNTEGTVGLFPVFLIETGFGLNAGARFIHRDLVGRGEKIKARASFGGRFRQIYALKLTSGDRLGDRVELELEGELEIRPKDTFHGIGNDLTRLDAADVEPPAAGFDPRRTSVKSRYQQDVGRVSLAADMALTEELTAKLSGAYFRRTFGSEGNFDPEVSIGTLYQTGALAAFDRGVSSLYLEGALRYDSRRAVNRWESEPVPGTGWVFGGFAGAARGLSDDPTAYLRYGVDLQRYLRLAPSPRTLAVRAYFEGVAGDRSEIPFSDLPRLGGPLLLRGYDLGRFRDRALALYGAEYQFDLNRRSSGVLFVDAGRVFRSLHRAFEELEGYRLGYGAALQLHTQTSFVARLTVASSVEGGLFFNLSLDPAWDPKARLERK